MESKQIKFPNRTEWKLPNEVVYQVDDSLDWIINHCFHRLDGPAIIYNDGDSSWWINGAYVDDEIREWAVDLGIDLTNLTEDDKVLIAIVWSDYNGK